jgi:hypothetical protein
LAVTVCFITPILCYIVIRPAAEIGVIDDWSYIKTAQLLAQTGHIAYNGWATAMLGWQLYFGAFFIKLFGFSFTAVRFSTIIEAMATAFLLHRTFVRAGLNTWNASLATMSFILSPLCLPLDFTFMSDVPGLFCIVLCIYMCFRSIQSQIDRSALVWISLAAPVNAAGGTVRQIAWLGVLVMVPSTLWLLRRKRRVFVAGCVACIAGVGIILAAMHWFALQPYSLPESPLPGRVGWQSLANAGRSDLHASGELALLALPVLLMFVGSPRSWNRRLAAIYGATILSFAVLGFALIHAGKVRWLIAPVADSMTGYTFDKLNAAVFQRMGSPMANYGLSFFCTGIALFGVIGFAAFVLTQNKAHPVSQPSRGILSWRQLFTVLGPFSIAYIVLLVPRTMKNDFFDRYLLALLAIALLLLTRYYQEKVQTNLPWACALLIAIFGGFSVLSSHDGFALYRGYLSAIDEMRSTGIPSTAILGPWEFSGWTEIEKVGHLNDPRIRIPEGAYIPQPERTYPDSCDWFPVRFLAWAPVVKPEYAVSLHSDDCDGQVEFPVVNFHTWTAPHVNSVYAVRLPPSFPK